MFPFLFCLFHSRAQISHLWAHSCHDRLQVEGMWLSSHARPKFLVSKTEVWLPQLSRMFSWVRREASLTIGKQEPREERYEPSTANWTLGITASAFGPSSITTTTNPNCASDTSSWIFGNTNWGCSSPPAILAKPLYPWWTCLNNLIYLKMAWLLLLIPGTGEQHNPLCCRLSTAQPGSPLISMKDSNRASAVEGAACKWLMHVMKKYTCIYCLKQPESLMLTFSIQFH